jgi:hypothetical protein
MLRPSFMCRRLIASLCAAALCGAFAAPAQPSYRAIDQPPHDYWNRPLQDPFTRFKNAVEAGKVTFDHSGEKAFLISVLKALNIPASSQMLVFSTTSLQLRFIKPSNPRALYFNEEVYLGYIPGGRIEVVSVDPTLGGIFYIFDIPRAPGPLAIERSDRCMNCHAAEDTGHVPGIVVKSVVPGPTGGSLTAYRIEQTGHQIPLSERFGGWYVTGRHAQDNHWGNIIGQFNNGALQKNPVPPGSRFDFGNYLVPTSDILPQLVHEHQAGFVNRVAEAGYRARTHLFTDRGGLTPEHAAELDEQARIVTRYLLFADEAKLPVGGLHGDPLFQASFALTRRPAKNGASLKDFDLRTRLFKHRCSYMIYTPLFRALPGELKNRIYTRLRAALDVERPDKDHAHLPADEKQAIRAILKETLTDLPKGW